MQIGALVRSYGLTNYLDAVLNSYDWVDKVIVMNYRFKGVKETKDETAYLALQHKNVTLKRGEDLNQHEVFNEGLKEFEGFDCVFIADNDEIIQRADQERIVNEIEGFDAVTCRILDYARSYDLIFPIRGHHPIVAVKPYAKFHDVRCSSCRHKVMSDIYIHHFGYVYTPEELTWKLDWEKPWEHSSVIDILSHVPQRYEMPEEIKEMLGDRNTKII
jgi:hypothetical protein